MNIYQKLVGDSQSSAYISDRLHKLLEILINYSPTRRAQQNIKEPLSAIIFVNEPFIAFVINVDFDLSIIN